MPSCVKVAIAVMMSLASPAVFAEVISASPHAFHIKIVQEIDAPKAKAYEKFLDIGSWWDSDHTWFGDAGGMYIEPKAGGCFCEVSGDKSVLHMLVSFVEPGAQIKLLGGLGPLQGLGLDGAMSFHFEAVSPAKTRLVHEYRVQGWYDDGLASLAAVVDKVQAGQVKRLAESFAASP